MGISYYLTALLLVSWALDLPVGLAKRRATKPEEEASKEKGLSVSKRFLKRIMEWEGDIRLVGGYGENEGNVEIFHLGRWITVCDNEWGELEAIVTCRQLGYRHALGPTYKSHFGKIRRKYCIDNMYCSGEEERLDECHFDPWGAFACNESCAAGVICYEPKKVDITTAEVTTAEVTSSESSTEAQHSKKLQVRLAGGKHYNEGRVEVKYGGSSWGVICGEGWSLLEALVVCRQLGYGFAREALQTDVFGGSSDDVVWPGVMCRGNESSLEHCRIRNNSESCKRDNIAAVICTKELADLIIDVQMVQNTTYFDDRPLYLLRCSLEERCLGSQAYKVQEEKPYSWQLETRRLLRFTTSAQNIGTADFRPLVPKSEWHFHKCHMHYHSMAVFARFEVRDASNTVNVVESHKSSYCLQDDECLPGTSINYDCANVGDQGISVNCTDTYDNDIDCQWIDITELKPGLYTLKVAVNPEFKAPEQTYENNAAVCKMVYSRSFVHVHDCHLERP